MRILTIMGTRPECIRLSKIIPKLDKLCEHVLVHTGQNYDPKLKDIFFEELGIRKPDFSFDNEGATTLSQHIGVILENTEAVLRREVKPDRLLLLGDTNSALSSYIARRMGIPVYHMEAGNRCHDLKSPEEANRVAIDHWSTVLMPYTEGGRQNLLAEGIASKDIFVIGNPIYEVLNRQAFSHVVRDRGLENKGYFLVTLHREENVDDPGRLARFLDGLLLVQKEYRIPIIVSCHPRTKKRMSEHGYAPTEEVCEPFGFKDFLTLEKFARCVLSDSGTVTEETTILHTPSVILRDTTERPEIIECGASLLSGSDPESILQCVRIALATQHQWIVPPEYLREDVSDTVCKIVLGYR